MSLIEIKYQTYKKKKPFKVKIDEQIVKYIKLFRSKNINS